MKRWFQISEASDKGRLRDSNMEFLRIIAMSMILTGHVFTHGLTVSVKPTPLYSILEPFFLCGVNLFFLISGWFGMRFSLRSFVKLSATTFFFIAVNILLLLVCGVGVELKTIADSFFFPVSKGKYWFIMVYLCLLILVPFINAGIENLPKDKFGKIMLLFTFFNLYSCWGGGNYVNVNGYTIVQAIWLYCVARWLRINKGLVARIPRYWWLIGFILCTLVVSIVGVVWKLRYFEYNSPFIFLASVALFVYFSQVSMRNCVVNRVAGASLGCYLLQDGLFGREYFYKLMEPAYKYIMSSYQLWLAITLLSVMIISLIAAYWLVSLSLTPLCDAFSRWVTRLMSRIAVDIGRSKSWFAKF